MITLKNTYFQKTIDTIIYIHENEKEGDVLAFLTGKSEIDDAVFLVKEELRKSKIVKLKAQVCAIYSSLETYKQKHIFDKLEKGYRKIVIATNIAQTSITIPGIKYVVDCGFVKQKLFDYKTGMDALMIVPISRAASIQRAGRAGRTFEGKVYRLYGKRTFEKLDEETTPEIQRTSLLETILNMKVMKIHDVINFNFIDQPDKKLIINALRKLFLLGALTIDGYITPLGTLISKFPLSPFLAKSLIESSTIFKCSKEVLNIVAMLSVEDVFLSPKNDKESVRIFDIKNEKFYSSKGDHLMLNIIYKEFTRNGMDKDWCFNNYLRYRNLKLIYKVRNQLKGLMKNNDLDIISYKQDKSLDETIIIKTFCSSFFLNVARRHPRRTVFYHYAMASSIELELDQEENNSLMGLYIHPNSILTGSLNDQNTVISDLDWLLYNQLIYTGKPLISCASKIQFEWVQPYLDQLKMVNDDLLMGKEVVTSNELDSSLEKEKINIELKERKQKQIEEAKLRFLKRKKE